MHSQHLPQPVYLEWSVPCSQETDSKYLKLLIISMQMCQMTRVYMGCFISDILSIGQCAQLHHANFNCFDCLGTARVRAYIYPIAPHLGGVQHRLRLCQHFWVRVKGGINLNEVLSVIMSKWAMVINRCFWNLITARSIKMVKVLKYLNRCCLYIPTSKT